ncbi:uncharacterized protein LOC130891569 [Diorhabda carinulata]|uniref:uncharacterized protein LOC130891569 n=1 Tax=Diorhabda carinulata TaxID=1163345 RepID=UPI0025A0904A|nr:uncharacterized protein LOC130891569 [Diorhabda carinulata]
MYFIDLQKAFDRVHLKEVVHPLYDKQIPYDLMKNMWDRNITILCYADDAVLVAKNEDDLQRLLNLFNWTAKSFNMIISASKTKCMTTSKTPIRRELVVDDQIIHQVMKFKYLGIEISGFGDVENEVRKQTTKALRIAACLNKPYGEINISEKKPNREYTKPR